MEKSQPIIVPPMARIPQIPPQQVAENRRGDKPSMFPRLSTPPYTPPLDTQRNPISPPEEEPITSVYPAFKTGIPITPPYSIPEYFAPRAKGEEPGVREMLLSCITLLFMGVIIVAILFYLST